MNLGMGFYKPLWKNVLRIAIYYLLRWVKPILGYDVRILNAVYVLSVIKYLFRYSINYSIN